MAKFFTGRAGIAGMMVLAGLAVAAGAMDLPFRDWTDRGDHQIRARLVGIDRDGGVVHLRLLFDGKIIEMAVENLTEADQDYVRAVAPQFEREEEEDPVPVGRWPVELFPPVDFAVEESRAEGGEFAYQTPHFRFRSDVKLAPSLIRQYALMFEATHHVIGQLPLRVGGKEEPDRFGVRFFKRHGDFVLAGGIAGSGGVYLPATKEILVPLTSLGVRVIGDQVAFNPETFDAAPLVHEITHQLMHRWLDVFPIWFCEGLAEYIAAVPFEGGRFDFRSIHEGVRRHLGKLSGEDLSEGAWRTLDVLHPGDLMGIGYRRWSDAVSDGTGAKAGVYYRSALLLIYFLVHLEGEGDGAALIRYFHETRGSELERVRYVEDYNGAVERYRKELSEWAETYNKSLILHRMETVAYNQKVEVYNQQVRAGFASEERIDPGQRPGPPPQPPAKPEPPGILVDNPDGQVPVDVAAAESAARDRLFGGRDGDGMWRAMETAFAKWKIRFQLVGAP